jgi:hypothetical protein
MGICCSTKKQKPPQSTVINKENEIIPVQQPNIEIPTTDTNFPMHSTLDHPRNVSDILTIIKEAPLKPSFVTNVETNEETIKRGLDKEDSPDYLTVPSDKRNDLFVSTHDMGIINPFRNSKHLESPIKQPKGCSESFLSFDDDFLSAFSRDVSHELEESNG